MGGEGLQQLVSDAVTVAIINLLEPLQVDVKAGNLAIAIYDPVQLLEQAIAIQKPCPRIPIGGTLNGFDVTVELASLRDHASGKEQSDDA
jgi:hypothetical protein